MPGKVTGKLVGKEAANPYSSYKTSTGTGAGQAFGFFEDYVDVKFENKFSGVEHSVSAQENTTLWWNEKYGENPGPKKFKLNDDDIKGDQYIGKVPQDVAKALQIVMKQDKDLSQNAAKEFSEMEPKDEAALLKEYFGADYADYDIQAAYDTKNDSHIDFYYKGSDEPFFVIDFPEDR